jgi:hypothetical protein
MKKVMSVFALVCVVFLFGCGEPNNGTGPNNPNVPVTPGKKQPGKFSAMVLSDAMGSNARGISLGTYTIANSKSIYFILRNVGDFPITNITIAPGKLTADGEAFVPITDNGITASPSGITVLETSGNTTVETIIEVDINHGNIIGLISQQYVHKADFTGTTLRIIGKTVDEENEVVDVSLDVDIETFIKVASFELHYSEDEGVTYKKAEYAAPPVQGSENERRFLIPESSKDYIKIMNTGNVPLRYKVVIGNNPDIEHTFEWSIIEASKYSNSFPLSYYGFFLIDTFGIAFDNGNIESLVFRPGTSIVIDSILPWYSYLAFYLY